MKKVDVIVVGIGLVLYFVVASLHFDIPVENLEPVYAQGSSWIVVDGTRVHINDTAPTAGEVRHTVVLLHGFASSLHTWEDWAAHLVEAGCRVVRFDMPGFGLTGPHADVNFVYRPQAWADFAARVMRELNISGACLCGNSLGGLVAAEVASRYPELVSHLVLIDARYPRGTNRPVILNFLALPGLRKLQEVVFPRWLVNTALSQVYFDQTKVTPQLLQRYIHMLTRAGNRKAMAKAMQVPVTQEDVARTRSLLQKIKQPTLILWGKEDRWVSHEVAHLYKEDIPHATVVIFRDLGHVPMEENPPVTVAEAKKFLALPLKISK